MTTQRRDKTYPKYALRTARNENNMLPLRAGCQEQPRAAQSWHAGFPMLMRRRLRRIRGARGEKNPGTTKGSALRALLIQGVRWKLKLCLPDATTAAAVHSCDSRVAHSPVARHRRFCRAPYYAIQGASRVTSPETYFLRMLQQFVCTPRYQRLAPDCGRFHKSTDECFCCQNDG